MNRFEIAVCAGGLDRPHEMAAQLSEQGVHAIETGPDFFLNSSADQIAEAVGILKEANVRTRSVHAPFGSTCNLSNPDETKRAEAVDTHRKLLQQCAHGGIQVIITHPGGGGFAPEQHPQMLEWCTEGLRTLAPIAEETGVSIGLENMLPGIPGASGEALSAVIEAVDSPKIGLCFDTGHAHCNGDLVGIFEAMKQHIVTFHLADNDGRSDQHLQPPYGTVSWEAFVRVFRTMEFDDALTVETTPWAGGGYRRLIEQVTTLLEHFEERIADREAKAASSNA